MLTLNESLLLVILLATSAIAVLSNTSQTNKLQKSHVMMQYFSSTVNDKDVISVANMTSPNTNQYKESQLKDGKPGLVKRYRRITKDSI